MYYALITMQITLLRAAGQNIYVIAQRNVFSISMGADEAISMQVPLPLQGEEHVIDIQDDGCCRISYCLLMTEYKTSFEADSVCGFAHPRAIGGDGT